MSTLAFKIASTTAVAPPLKREFISYIHNFRGVAIIFVVAGHLLLDWASDSKTYLFLRALWENGTVLFIFIAGYLFQYLSRKFEYKDYLRKKLQNVIIPYFIISVPIIAYRLLQHDYPGYIMAEHPDFLSWDIYKKLSFFIFTGAHMQQLWFIPMITLFYLAAPLLIYIDRHPKLYLLLFPLIALSLWVEREPFTDIPRMFVHFLSVYMFGMFMSRYKNEYIEFAKKFWLPISVITLGLLAATYFYYHEMKSALNYVQKMFFCCFFIYWLWRIEKFVPKTLSYLAEVSFGIFFIHYYGILIIKALYQKFAGQPIPGNLAYWLLDFILVMTFSIAVIIATKKIFPKKSRYLIGC